MTVDEFFTLAVFAVSMFYIAIIRAAKQSREARTWMISQLRGEEDE